ncbi:hypothetical protein V6Z11_D10G161600 [Gossypium hirsutum]
MLLNPSTSHSSTNHYHQHSLPPSPFSTLTSHPTIQSPQPKSLHHYTTPIQPLLPISTHQAPFDHCPSINQSLGLKLPTSLELTLPLGSWLFTNHHLIQHHYHRASPFSINHYTTTVKTCINNHSHHQFHTTET